MVITIFLLYVHVIFYFQGATSYGLMKQAKRFVERLLLVPKYDFFGSWKVLTLFIGGNDLCSCCRRYKNLIDKYSPANFAKGVFFGLIRLYCPHFPSLYWIR